MRGSCETVPPRPSCYAYADIEESCRQARVNVPDMSAPHSSRLGVTFASLGVLGPGAVPELARRASELGYGSFWTAEATGSESFTVSDRGLRHGLLVERFGSD